MLICAARLPSQSLLRSAVQCIREARSAFHRPDFGTHVDYVTSLSNFQN